MKSFFRSGPVVAVIGWLIWAWMALCGRTIRWQIEGSETARANWAEANGVIVAAWHSTILILPTGWNKLMRKWPGRRAPVAMMISLSKDGEPVAQAIKHLGLEAIRGSSSHKRKNKDKGGARAAAEAIRLLKAGGAVCITPDGPRGPRQRAQLGPVLLGPAIRRTDPTLCPCQRTCQTPLILGSFHHPLSVYARGNCLW